MRLVDLSGLSRKQGHTSVTHRSPNSAVDVIRHFNRVADAEGGNDRPCPSSPLIKAIKLENEAAHVHRLYTTCHLCASTFSVCVRRIRTLGFYL